MARWSSVRNWYAFRPPSVGGLAVRGCSFSVAIGPAYRVLRLTCAGAGRPAAQLVVWYYGGTACTPCTPLYTTVPLSHRPAAQLVVGYYGGTAVQWCTVVYSGVQGGQCRTAAQMPYLGVSERPRHPQIGHLRASEPLRHAQMPYLRVSGRLRCPIWASGSLSDTLRWVSGRRR